MNKVITIVIPSYNMEAYLPQNLDSLITENIDDVEILVINDGSKDKTSDIGHEYERRYPNSIRVIDKSNGHYGSCVNCGLAEATGKYIKILDADDSFDNNNFGAFVEYLKTTDADMVLSEYSFVNADGIVFKTKKYMHSGNKQNLSFKEALSILTDDILEMHGIAYKVTLLRFISYKQIEGMAYTDIQWNFVPMLYVSSISCFDRVVYKYLVGRDGQSVAEDTFNKSIKEHLILVNEMIDQYAIRLRDIEASIREYFIWRLVFHLRWLYHNIISLREHMIYYHQLYEIDQKIKEIDKVLYDKVEHVGISKIPYNLVGYWRKKYAKRKHMPMISMYQTILNWYKQI